MSPVQSTTVDAGPPRIGPPSMTSATASPSMAATSFASRASGCPDRLADVVGSGPSADASARGAGWSGTRTPIVGVPAASTSGRRTPGWTVSTSVRPPGQKASREDASGGRRDAQTPGLVGVGEQHGHGLLGRPPLRGEQALDGVRQREVRGDPVDGVGRDRDDPAGAQQLDRLGPRRVAVGEDPGRRHETSPAAAAAMASAASRSPLRLASSGGARTSASINRPTPSSSTGAAT